MSNEQVQSARRGDRAVDKLRRGYDKLSGAVRKVGGRIKGAIGRITSLQGILTGALAFGAGRSFIEQTIGQADQVRRGTKLLGAVFKEQSKVNQAVSRARDLTKEISGLSLGQAITGLEKTSLLADRNVDKAVDLVRLAKALEQTKPEESFEGALFALKELESGDTMSLRERFGLRLPTRSEAEGLAKKDGKTLKQFYVDRLRDEIDKRYAMEGKSGMDVLFSIDRDTIKGQLSQLKTAASDILLSIGQRAEGGVFDALKDSVQTVRELTKDPEFQRAVDRFGEGFATTIEKIARVAPKIISKIPDAANTVLDVIEAAADFYDKHPTLSKTLAGLVAANYLTGGLVGEAGKGIVGRVLGKSDAGNVGGVGDMAGMCCCDDGNIPGTGGKGGKGGGGTTGTLGKLKNFLKTGSTGGLAAGGLTGAEAGAVSLGAGQIATGLGAMALPFAVGATGMYSWSKALGAKAEAGKSQTFDRMMRDSLKKRFTKQVKAGNVRGLKADVMGLLGGPGKRFESDKQAARLSNVDDVLAEMGLDVDLGRGQKVSSLKFKKAGFFESTLFEGEGVSDLNSQLTAGSLSRQLNNINMRVTVNVPANADVDGEQVKRMAKEGAKEGSEQALRQANRKRRATVN
ncbi:MAG: hypothetical protein U5L04_02645 [Trueperaceae bacterium]|nr:hypothetical protein [Trueperaceae bacterium]